MNLVPATRDYSLYLYRWRTDPTTETMSLAPVPVSYEAHLKWLDRTLADSRVRLYVAEADGVAVGTGRLTIFGSDAELSVTVAPEHRGLGYGTKIVGALVEQARALDLKAVYARVLGSNVPSLFSFLRNDFVPETSAIRLDRTL